LLRIARTALCTLLLPAASLLRAQEKPSPNLDLAITFIAERSLRATNQDTFWMQGGSIELGTNAWHGLGIAANLSGTHTNAVGATTIPLSLVTMTFGPRYRWHAARRVSIYGEGLIGEANGFKSAFPATAGVQTPTQTSANGLAIQVECGVDYKLSRRIAVRAIEAAWQHTQLPNEANNVQNDLRIGAGFILRFGH
jgi:Outer membrane protein beta-barrel domain